MNTLFAEWQKSAVLRLKNLQPGFHPKALIQELSEELLMHYTGKALIDNYHVYQHLMDLLDCDHAGRLLPHCR